MYFNSINDKLNNGKIENFKNLKKNLDSNQIK